MSAISNAISNAWGAYQELAPALQLLKVGKLKEEDLPQLEERMKNVRKSIPNGSNNPDSARLHNTLSRAEALLQAREHCKKREGMQTDRSLMVKQAGEQARAAGEEGNAFNGIRPKNTKCTGWINAFVQCMVFLPNSKPHTLVEKYRESKWSIKEDHVQETFGGDFFAALNVLLREEAYSSSLKKGRFVYSYDYTPTEKKSSEAINPMTFSDWEEKQSKEISSIQKIRCTTSLQESFISHLFPQSKELQLWFASPDGKQNRVEEFRINATNPQLVIPPEHFLLRITNSSSCFTPWLFIPEDKYAAAYGLSYRLVLAYAVLPVQSHHIVYLRTQGNTWTASIDDRILPVKEEAAMRNPALEYKLCLYERVDVDPSFLTIPRIFDENYRSALDMHTALCKRPFDHNGWSQAAKKASNLYQEICQAAQLPEVAHYHLATLRTASLWNRGTSSSIRRQLPEIFHDRELLGAPELPLSLMEQLCVREHIRLRRVVAAELLQGLYLYSSLPHSLREEGFKALKHHHPPEAKENSLRYIHQLEEELIEIAALDLGWRGRT